MNKGGFEAAKFIEKLGINSPLDLSIEEIAFSQGAFIKFCEMDGADGRIILQEDNAIITINSNLTYSPKIRFIIAHELGHFYMHKNLKPIFTDDDTTLNMWLAKGTHELEANSFAAELLMPSKIFSNFCKGRFSMNLIKDLASQYQTSLTSTLLRYKDFGDFPIALIYSEDRIVKWTQFSHDFVLQFIPIKSFVPINTVANDIYNGCQVPETPEKIDALDWFANDFNVSRYKRWQFNEQCFKVAPNAVLSCLWGY